MSLFDEIKSAAEQDKLRLHTPGHKGALCEYDLTELTDDSFPSDAVAKAESRAAAAYGVKHAKFLCGGSSQGVKASVYYAAADAVVDINSHRSVFDGFMLSGKAYVAAGEKGCVRPLTVEQIDRALTPQTKAVVVTTPTYYGYCADNSGIAEYCAKKGLLFIADSAHGAHFGFAQELPESVARYCDICNVSAHKTLSALTQSAILLDNLDDTRSAALSDTVELMGTTSPSYLLYASVDGAISKVTGGAARERYKALYAPLCDLRKEFVFLDNDDYTRPVLDAVRMGISPYKLNKRLCLNGVYSEKVDDRYIVFIFTAENTPNDVERLKIALRKSIGEIE